MSTRFGANVLRLQEPAEAAGRVIRFLKTHTERIGAKTLVVGMSGGLDSSVAAILCSKAIGSQRTLGMCLPESETLDAENLRDAQTIARKHGIKLRTIDMTPLTEATKRIVTPLGRDRIPWGNVKARLRAMLLYYYANKTRGLVVGTGDKSEILLGYFTKYGDGACDIQPLADLYKTNVRDLAKHFKLSPRIYLKPSSPELWPGQTAEKELGLPYEILDMILWGLERWMSPAEIGRDLGIPAKTVERVKSRLLFSEHKRRPPLSMKMGFRTAGQDLHLPNIGSAGLR